MADSYTPTASDRSGGRAGDFNQPELDKRGKPLNKPVESAMQAYQVYLRFKKQNRVRAMRNRIIADK
ncbi:MAG TPA: hypothetical protein VHS80_13960, partial [Chthoniobacterales bacterium]|nr:hypothetical protein [Chthoniobacterales bacterium]